MQAINSSNNPAFSLTIGEGGSAHIRQCAQILNNAFTAVFISEEGSVAPITMHYSNSSNTK